MTIKERKKGITRITNENEKLSMLHYLRLNFKEKMSYNMKLFLSFKKIF